MSFITYSQNFEDLILWRALKDVEEGFYIDVGANDSIKDSVTKAFYDKGWSGINIEPEYRFYRSLKKDRIRDINLNCAISSTYKEIPLYVSKLRGWSTTNKDVSQSQEEQSLVEEVITVEAKTLDAVVKENESKISDIHFLKVDVEGAEKDVLESFSFVEYKPWIVVVESTAPGTNEDVSNLWEHLLLDKGYFKVYFDGVNKYYLSDEKECLKSAFLYPPNVVDDWIHIDHKQAMENAQRLKIQLKNEKNMTKSLSNRLEKEISTSQRVISLLKLEIEGFYNSKSWKITKPLRTVMSLLKKDDEKEQKIIIQEEPKDDVQKKKIDNKPKLFKEAEKLYKDLTCE